MLKISESDEIYLHTIFKLKIYVFWIFTIISVKFKLTTHAGVHQGWGQVKYLYLSTYLSVLEYLVYGNVKVLVLDQKVLGTYK